MLRNTNFVNRSYYEFSAQWSFLDEYSRLQAMFPNLDSLLIVTVSRGGLEAGKKCTAVLVG